MSESNEMRLGVIHIYNIYECWNQTHDDVTVYRNSPANTIPHSGQIKSLWEHSTIGGGLRDQHGAP